MGIDQTRANQAMNAAAALGTAEAFSENEVIVANHVIPAARVIAKVVGRTKRGTAPEMPGSTPH